MAMPRPNREALADAMTAGSNARDVNFIGELSKIFNKDMRALAEEMLKKGASRDEILKDTGMYRQQGYPSLEGMPRQDTPWNWKTEIAGSQAKATDRLKEAFADPYFFGNYEAPLGELLDYPDLYAAYPDLEGLNIGYKNLKQGEASGGEYRRALEGITITPDQIARGATSPRVITAEADRASALRAILMHEIQHAIQFREGWPRGGSPGQIPNAKDILRRIQGKVQPRFDALQGLRDPGVDEMTWMLSPETGVDGRLLQQYRTMLNPPGKWDEQTAVYNMLEGENEARNAAWRANFLEPGDLRSGGTLHPEMTADYPSSLTYRMR